MGEKRMSLEWLMLVIENIVYSKSLIGLGGEKGEVKRRSFQFWAGRAFLAQYNVELGQRIPGQWIKKIALDYDGMRE